MEKKRSTYTIEGVNAHISVKYGGTCLSIVSGKGRSGKIGTFMCPKGHTWVNKVAQIMQADAWCKKCSMVSIEDAKKIAIEHGGECLSEDIINTTTKLQWKCANNHIWAATYSCVKYGESWCKQCRRVSLDDAKKLAADKNGECISDKIISASAMLSWRCAAGHIWEQKYYHIQSGHWCRKCATDKGRLKQDDINAIAESRGGKCLSVYKDYREPLQWQCKKGHTFWSCINSVKDRSSWCHDCKLKGESQCRTILEQALGVKFVKARPEWMKNDEGNKLELDGYNEDPYKLAFEFNGMQHYEVVEVFQQTQETLERQQLHDRIKLEACEKNGVRLIVIPYTAKTIEKKKAFIFAELTKMGIPFDATKVTIH